MNLNTLVLVAEAIDTLATQLNVYKPDILYALLVKRIITEKEYGQLADYFLE